MGNSNRNQGKSTEAALAEQLAAGTKTHFATAASLAFASATFTPAQVEASLNTLASLRNDVEDAKVALEAKLAAEAEQLPTLRAFMSAYVQFLLATFSKSPGILADFGLKAKKAKAPLTVEQKAAAAAKRKATRAARGTTSAKKKALIKGNVTGVVVTPVTASPEPAAAVGSGGGTSTPATAAAGATTAPTTHS